MKSTSFHQDYEYPSMLCIHYSEPTYLGLFRYAHSSAHTPGTEALGHGTGATLPQLICRARIRLSWDEISHEQVAELDEMVLFTSGLRPACGL